MEMLEEICPSCGKGKLVTLKKEKNVETKQFSCGDSVIDVEAVIPNPELRIKLKSPRGKRKFSVEIDSRIKEGFER